MSTLRVLDGRVPGANRDPLLFYFKAGSHTLAVKMQKCSQLYSNPSDSNERSKLMSCITCETVSFVLKITVAIYYYQQRKHEIPFFYVIKCNWCHVYSYRSLSPIFKLLISSTGVKCDFNTGNFEGVMKFLLPSTFS